MADNDKRDELDSRIAVLRDNLRQLVEQGAAQSGAANETMIADRIANYEEQLAPLITEREALRD